MGNCLITFTRWSATRWLALAVVAASAFVSLSISGQLISNLSSWDNPFASLPFAVFYSLLIGIYAATQVRDSNYLPDASKHKWVAISLILAVSHPVAALVGLFLLMPTVRSRISSESACSLPTPRTIEGN